MNKVSPVLIILFSFNSQVLSIGFPNKNAAKTSQDQGYGSNDFKTFVTTKKKMYIDKTLFIKEAMNRKDKAILITRPPKFGKSLMLSTLDYFLSDRLEASALFSGLDIMKKQVELDQFRDNHMGKHSVVRLDFTNVRGSTFQESYSAFQESISNEFSRHKYVLGGKEFLTAYFESILHKNASEERLADSINWLCSWIRAYHNGTKRCIVLLDGYNTPIYTNIRTPIRENEGFLTSFLLRTLKTNINLEKAIITGVIPHATEIFPELVTLTILEKEFSQFFGFTQRDVTELVNRTDVEVEKTLERINALFNGYNFGGVTMFNPRAVSQYLFEGKTGGSIDPTAQVMLEGMLVGYGLYPILTFQQLLEGEDVSKEIPVENDPETHYWGFMLHAGHLTVSDVSEQKNGGLRVVLRIPNLEIRAVIATALRHGSELRSVKIPSYRDFIADLASADFASAQTVLELYLKQGGVFLKPVEHKYDADRISRFVFQMLRGLEVRYDANVTRTDYMKPCGKTDGFPDVQATSVEINPKKNEGVPIKVWIRKTRTTGVLWNRVNRMLCPLVKKLEPNQTEILIMCSERFVSTCLVRQGFVLSQLDSWQNVKSFSKMMIPDAGPLCPPSK